MSGSLHDATVKQKSCFWRREEALAVLQQLWWLNAVKFVLSHFPLELLQYILKTATLNDVNSATN